MTNRLYFLLTVHQVYIKSKKSYKKWVFNVHKCVSLREAFDLLAIIIRHCIANGLKCLDNIVVCVLAKKFRLLLLFDELEFHFTSMSKVYEDVSLMHHQIGRSFYLATNVFSFDMPLVYFLNCSFKM